MVNPPPSALSRSLKRPPDSSEKLPRPLSASFSPVAIPISPPRNHRRSSRRLSFGGPWTPSSPTLGPSVSLPPSPSTSFVGSYENSLLSGRMSTPLSNPLEFTCEIGVIASRSSSSGPRCPPHVSLPFEAAFYRTGDGVDSASPYVGTVDLESYYHSAAAAALPSKTASLMPIGDSTHVDADDDIMDDLIEHSAPSTRNTTSKPCSNSSNKLVHSFPGYRIPPKGQVQLIIRNSTNPTPVKIYLVPYDLEDMPPSTKTFLRQKSYSVVPSSTKDSTNKSFERESLRYAVHLQFCSPYVRPNKQRKFYLHKTIRFVFSNRRMDPDEKLRVVNESLEGVVDESSSTSMLSSSLGSSTSSSSSISRSSDKAFVPYAGPGEHWTSLVKSAKSSYATSISDRRKSFDPAFMRRSIRGITGSTSAPPTNQNNTRMNLSNNTNYNNNRHHRRLSDSWALIDNLQTDIDEEEEDHDHFGGSPYSPDYSALLPPPPPPPSSTLSSFDFSFSSESSFSYNSNSNSSRLSLPPSRLSLNSIPDDSDSEDVFIVEESSSCSSSASSSLPQSLAPPISFDPSHHSFLYTSPNTPPPLQQGSTSSQLDLDTHTSSLSSSPSLPSSQLTSTLSRSMSRSETPTPRDYNRPIR